MVIKLNIQKVIESEELINFLFFPKPFQHPIQESNNLRILRIQVEDNIYISGLFHIINKKLPTLMIFHGNAETSEVYNYYIKDFLSLNVNIAVFDYRGYGFSNGVPTIKNLIEDSTIIYKEFKKYLESNSFNPEVFVMGRSLGSLVAGEIGKQFSEDPLGFIFESSIADTYKAMQDLFFIKVDLDKENKDFLSKYTNISKLPLIKRPTLIIHGIKDNIVSLYHPFLIGLLLPKNIPKKVVLIKDADHNTIMLFKSEYFGPLRIFIKKYKNNRKLIF